MEERVPKKIESGESFGTRLGGIFRRLLDVLELKHLISKRERDYIIGDISEEEFKNELSCSNCDRFGQNCGSCEVDEDD